MIWAKAWTFLKAFSVTFGLVGFLVIAVSIMVSSAMKIGDHVEKRFGKPYGLLAYMFSLVVFPVALVVGMCAVWAK